MRHKPLVVLVAVIAAVAPLVVGAPAGSSVAALGVTKTLYFHSALPAATLDEVNEFGATGPGPFMDANPPTDPTPSVATSTGAGNLAFRKNFLNAYWGGKTNGLVAQPTVSFWVTAPAVEATVAIFGDGGIGAASPVATKKVTLGSPAPALVSVKFEGLEMAVENEFVVQISAELPPASGNVPAIILFDSPNFSSATSFTLSPLPLLPKLDDPFGLVHRTTDLVVANSGTGHVLVTDLAGVALSSIAGGFVPGGFTRGVTGMAADAAGTIYYAIAETGEIRFEPTAGAGGVYARGLGAVQGIAFDAAGDLFAADAAARRVIRTTPSGIRTVVASGFGAAPSGLAFAPDGTLAVSTQRDAKVYSIDLSSATKSIIADLGANHSAEGLAYAASGNLYIGDGRAGRLVRRTTAGALEEVKKDLGGPLSLAFKPGSNDIAVATQGEGRPTADAILEVDSGENGLALATPTLSPTALPAAAQTWGHLSGGIALDPGSLSDPLISAESRYTGNNGFEPTMAIQTPAGGSDIFTTGGDFDQAGGVLGSPKVYRSRDNGQTWSDITPKNPVQPQEDAPPITLDPYIYVDETTNRVFNPELIAGCIYMSYSDNDGDDWSSSPLGCGIPPVDHQTIVAGKPRFFQTNGYPNVLYHCSNWVAASPCGRSLDGGATWHPAGIAQAAGLADIYRAPDDRSPDDLGVECSSLTGHMVSDHEGRVFLPRAACGRPIISVSEDDGTTWNTYLIDPAFTVGANQHETIVAADSTGKLFYVWIGINRLPYMASSDDHGKTWSAPRMVAPPGVTETNIPSIAAGGPGQIAILYMGTTADYGYTEPNEGKAGWNVYMTISDDATVAEPIFQTTTVRPLADPMIRSACGPGRCGNVFDFLDIIIDSGGRAWATFVDTCTGPCIANRTASSTDAKGGVAPLLTGPSLRGSGSLPPLA
jgi:hypothetical protein